MLVKSTVRVVERSRVKTVYGDDHNVFKSRNGLCAVLSKKATLKHLLLDCTTSGRNVFANSTDDFEVSYNESYCSKTMGFL